MGKLLASKSKRMMIIVILFFAAVAILVNVNGCGPNLTLTSYYKYCGWEPECCGYEGTAGKVCRSMYNCKRKCQSCTDKTLTNCSGPCNTSICPSAGEGTGPQGKLMPQDVSDSIP